MAAIDLVEVVGVDPDKCTVWVMGHLAEKEADEVPYAAPYISSSHAGGNYFVPEVGSDCYLFTADDGTKFVTAFVNNPQRSRPESDHDDKPIEGSSSDGPDFSGFREQMDPGDIYLGTAEGNRVFIRKGGVVEISSTPMCGRIYIPIENLVQDYFQRYRADSPLGSVEWGHASVFSAESMSSVNPKEDAGVPVLVKYNIKSNIKDPTDNGKMHAVEVRLGDLGPDNLDLALDESHVFGSELEEDFEPEAGEDTAGLLSVTVSDPNAGRVTYSFQVGRDGSHAVICKGRMHVEVSSGIYVKSPDGAKMDFGNEVDSCIEAGKDGDLSASVQSATIDSVGEVSIGSQSTVIVDGTEVHIGGNAKTAVTWEGLAAYFTEMQALNADPTKPLVLPPDMVSFKSTKVKLL